MGSPNYKPGFKPSWRADYDTKTATGNSAGGGSESDNAKTKRNNSRKIKLVEIKGFKPLASAMRMQRSIS